MRNAKLMLPDQSVWCPTTGKCYTECMRKIEEKMTIWIVVNRLMGFGSGRQRIKKALRLSMVSCC